MNHSRRQTQPVEISGAVGPDSSSRPGPCPDDLAGGLDSAVGMSWGITEDVLDVLRQMFSNEPKFQPKAPDVPEEESEHLQSLSQLGLFGD